MLTHNKLRYLLTLVDAVIGWIEAFLASRKMADVVAQVLLDHIISQYGVPWTIQMDNGAAFTSRIMELLSDTLNISWKFHIPDHP